MLAWVVKEVFSVSSSTRDCYYESRTGKARRKDKKIEREEESKENERIKHERG